MFSRRISVGVLAGIVGMAMLIATSAPSAAFTLSSPSLEKPFVGAFVEQVWWDRWGRWHGGWHRWHGGWGWHRWHRWGWGWHRPAYRYYGYYQPVRHCWVGPWGGWRCTW
jgi:hypothetical protein